MSKEEAIQLGCEAVKAGILTDLYSGSNVDVCVIDYAGVESLRNYMIVESPKNTTKVIYPNNSVEILKKDIYKYIEEINELCP
jgi:20S proteasome subunit beta 2